MSELQLFPSLDPATEAALRASIEKWGVLVPVHKDQHGRIIDGHHRSRIADELGVDYVRLVHHVESDEQAKELAYTLNADRRQMDVTTRRQVVAQLRSQGHSTRAIAEAVGVSQPTVHRDIESTDSHESVPDRIVGKDGKSRPARRPTVFTKNRGEDERAQAALTDLDEDAPARTIDIKRVERIARETNADRRRAEPINPVSIVDQVEIRHGDFREVLNDLAGQVDAIITDPPYPKRYWEQHSADNVYEGLGEVARDLLKPDGVLAVMVGTRPGMVESVDSQLGRHVQRRWRAVYLVSGQRWRDQTERVATGYKPILIYGHPDHTDRPWILDDVFTSGNDDKRFHHWGQSESGFASIVERLTEYGALVVDPFLGGGTTGVVCRDLGRRFIGCDIDGDAIQTARERLS